MARASMPWCSRSRLALQAILAIAVILGPSARPAIAQDQPHSVGEFAAGALLFPDDSLATEPFLGGAARFYLSPRVSLGPEVAYIDGENHRHLMVTGNVTFDLVASGSGGARPVTPFVVIGGGLFRTRETFPNREAFASAQGPFTAGGGVRASIGNSLLVGAEARIRSALEV